MREEDGRYQSSLNDSRSQSSFITFRHFIALAFILVFYVSGMVSTQDVSFVVFSLMYILFLSKVAFPPQTPSTGTPIIPKNQIFRLYISFAALIGLFLPIAYILHGVLVGDKAVEAAAPHFFLLASQVFLEGVTASMKFSIPIQVFVPVFYNTKRIFTIWEWLRYEFEKVEEFGRSERRLVVGRGLAVANVAFWCFNLFVFLLPVYLPKAFKRYYGRMAKL